MSNNGQIQDAIRLLPEWAPGADRAYVNELSRYESEQRYPDLFNYERKGDNWKHYRLRNDGEHTSITALYEAHELTEQEIFGLRQYTLSQYLLTGYFDPTIARQHNLDAEPGDDYVSNGDLVVVSGTPDGQILNMAKVRFGSHRPDLGVAIGDYANRQTLLGPEMLFGNDVYSCCPEIQSVDAGRTADMERYVARRSINAFDAANSALEIGLALMNVIDAYKNRINMVTGDLEKDVAGRHFADVYALPIVFIEGFHPNVANLPAPYNQLLIPRYTAEKRGKPTEVMPFALKLNEVTEVSKLRAKLIDQTIHFEGYGKARRLVMELINNRRGKNGSDNLHMPSALFNMQRGLENVSV